MSKRGQFFLMAAILIVGALIGLTTIANYVDTGASNDQFYDLGDEIGFEAKQVLDYGTYNQQETGQLVQSLLENYSSYIAEDQVIFIYGDTRNITAFYFNERVLGNVGIDTGGSSPTNIPISQPGLEETEVQTINGKVIVRVNGIDYTFLLRPGQNFYFVLVRDEEEDRFVTAG